MSKIPELSKAWKSTCKLLLGEEIGELETYRDYLKKYSDPMSTKISAISGKEVYVSSDKFCQRATFLSHEEIPEYEQKTKKFKLNINEIKDIDSIINAAQENFQYVGNVVLGNSRDAISCHRCVNTSYALECQDIYAGKYVAYSSSVRDAEHAFGASGGGNLNFGIRTLEVFKLMRSFETLRCYSSADLYYCASCEDCSNCLFSFNLRSKNYHIGNLQFNREKYLALKEKLLADVRDELKAKKAAISMVDIINS